MAWHLDVIKEYTWSILHAQPWARQHTNGTKGSLGSDASIFS